MRTMGTLSAQLAESEKTVRALERQLESTKLEKNEIYDQLQAANTQVGIHYSFQYCYPILPVLCPPPSGI